MQKIAVVHGTSFARNDILLNKRIEKAYSSYQDKQVDTIICAGGIPGNTYSKNAELAADILHHEYHMRKEDVLTVGGKHFIGEYREVLNANQDEKVDIIFAPMEDVSGRIHRLKKSYRLAIGSKLVYPEHVVLPIVPEFKIFVTRVKEVCYEAVANTLLYLPRGEHIMDELRKNTKE